MNVKRIIKAIALVFIVISVSMLYAAEEKIKEIDWKYDVNYAGERVGYNRIVLRSILNGERLSEIGSVLIPSFLGDTHIHSFKFENYNADRYLVQADYVYLYDGYLLRAHLETTEREGLQQRDFIYALDDAELSQLQSTWAQTFEDILSNDLLVELFFNQLQSLTLLDSSLTNISQKNFDMTPLALSIRLPEELFKKHKKPIRIFDPESEEVNPFYEISIHSKRVGAGNGQLKSVRQNVQKASIIINGEKLMEYWYDLDSRPINLLKIVDESSGEYVEIVLVK
jgi:hypothetical protein